MQKNNLLFVSHDNIEKKKWDECVTHSLNELPYAYTWFLDCVCEKWDALVLNDYEAVFPLTWNKKAGVYYLYQPYFTQQLGIFSREKISPALVESFLESIPEKFKLVEINLNSENDYPGSNFSVKKKLTHHLSLNKNQGDIFASYNENTKRNLKKAAKENLSVTLSVSPEELISLFKKNQGRKVKELKTKDYERLKNLMTVALKNNSGEIIGVTAGNHQLCAAGFFIRSQRFIINLFPSSNEAGKKNGAMFLLLDEMLKKYAGSKLIFDFEGSEISSIAKFYKGFGSQEVFYPHIKRNNLPWHLKWLKK